MVRQNCQWVQLSWHQLSVIYSDFEAMTEQKCKWVQVKGKSFILDLEMHLYYFEHA